MRFRLYHGPQKAHTGFERIPTRILELMYAGCGFAPRGAPAPLSVAAEFSKTLLRPMQKVTRGGTQNWSGRPAHIAALVP